MTDVQLMILGFLSSGAKTGYRLNQIFGKLMLYYAVGLNQIYPVLKNLEAEGLVEKEVVFQVGKPSKNVYSITPAGQAYLTEKLTGPAVPMDYHLPFLQRVFFFRFLNHDQVLEAFQSEICSIDEQINTLEEMEDTVKEYADTDGEFAYRTALHFLKSLADWYKAEYSKRRQQ
ncbi:MAG: PadR family transcriptional regulator [Deltaproteobacteria bacterium]|nr:PadR family transcriptional regulator [Candidatus Zymogenaceae bacterium]